MRLFHCWNTLVHTRKLFSSLANSSLPSYVRIVEVGPRDGLQNEKIMLPTSRKVEFVNRLSETGLPVIEVTSFVSPTWIPQLGDGADVMQKISRKSGVKYTSLVPNMKGLESALKVGVEEVAIFTSASETFTRKNINCSIEESLDRFKQIAAVALKEKVTVRGYVSCVLGCPYEGPVSPSAVLRVTNELLAIGCYEISLGDTIGIGTAGSMRRLLEELTLNKVSTDKLAVHCHDTYGQALTNILVALEYDISVVDSSVSGLGGCPYAKGASGNVATEDVVYMLNGLGIQTNVNLEKLIDVSLWISSQLGRDPHSKVTLASLGTKPK